MKIDSGMLLRKNQDHGLNEMPFFVIFLPGNSFKIYQVEKNINEVNIGGSALAPATFGLRETQKIDFRVCKHDIILSWLQF